jgi:hypothetical protein
MLISHGASCTRLVPNGAIREGSLMHCSGTVPWYKTRCRQSLYSTQLEAEALTHLDLTWTRHGLHFHFHLAVASLISDMNM